MYKSILVPISQGTEDIEAVAVIDLLRRANYNVLVAGDAEIITCANGTRIIPDKHIDEIPDNAEFDAIILPGGLKGISNLEENEKLEILLQNHCESKRLIGAICAAPLLLLSKGFLPIGATITSYPEFKASFKDYVYQEESVVEFENLITSRGAGTVFEFCHKLISKLKDEESADAVLNKIIYKK